MAVTVNTAEELGKAINEKEDEIIIEGDIKRHTLRIKATGKVAWVIAFGAIAVAVVAVLATAGSGGTASPATLPATGVACSIAATALGGVSTVVAAITVAVAAGGMGVLTSLRKNYKLVQSDGVAKLIRK